ncbi:MAG: glycosyl hydrolase family 18 protein, partial [candidate division WOR-3 bacterium]
MRPLIYLILLVFQASEFYSVHQTEYFSHYTEAEFSKISDIPIVVEPLQEGKGLLKTFYGYVPYWVDTTALKSLDWSLITHVAYFSIGVSSDGSLSGIPNSSRFIFLINYAHLRGVRVHITFTIFGNSSVSSFLNNASARQNAITQIVNFVENYNIEGVNIDF